jgi:hypothetical protein
VVEGWTWRDEDDGDAACRCCGGSPFKRLAKLDDYATKAPGKVVVLSECPQRRPAQATELLRVTRQPEAERINEVLTLELADDLRLLPAAAVRIAV